MKRRYLSLFLILTLILTLFGATGVALAQNPQGDPATATVEPTQGETTVTQTDPVTDTAATTEPTEAPTAEPTAAPTEAPTAEPTVAPTEAPTVEPTVVPTEEPTVAPTEEPTAEPTATPVDLPVVDSFAAAPASLTGDGTTVLTTTLTWAVTGADTLDLNGEDVSSLTEKIVELTQTTTYTLKAVNAGGSVESVVVVDVVAPVVVESAGDIETAAIAGSWSTEVMHIQNISGVKANVDLALYDSAGNNVQSISKTDIPVGGGVSINASDLSNNGKFSGVVSSDTPVAVGAFNINATGTVGDMYLGTSNPAQEVILPILFRNHSFWQSKMYIQNAHSSAQNISVEAFPLGSSTPSDSPIYNIPANTTLEVDFMSNDFVNFGSGQGKYGYARVTGADGPVAVVVSSQKNFDTQIIETLYKGMPSTDAGTELIMPFVYNGHSFWDSGIVVVNTSNVTTTVTLQYTKDALYGGTTETKPKQLGPNAAIDFYLPAEGLTRPSFGGAKLTSSNSSAKIVAISNYVKYNNAGGAVGSLAPAFNKDSATTKLAIPFGYNESFATGTQTGLVVYNIDSSGTVTTTWTAADLDPSTNSTVKTLSGSANGISSFYAPTIGIPSNFKGVIYVESSGQKIVGWANQTYYSKGIGAVIPGQNY